MRIFDELHCVSLDSSRAASFADFMEGTGADGYTYTDIFNLAKYRKAAFVIQMGAGATGTGVVTVESCDDVSPSTSTAVAFVYKVSTTFDVFGDWTAASSSGFTTTAGANACYIIEVDASELSSTDNFVRCKITEDTDSPTDGCILTILGQPRVMLENPITAIV